MTRKPYLVAFVLAAALATGGCVSLPPETDAPGTADDADAGSTPRTSSLCFPA